MLGWDAVALRPRTHSVQRHSTRHRNFFGSASLSYDLGMSSHVPIMQNALLDCKRLLHYGLHYCAGMATPNERLRQARAKKYETAVEAADAMGVPRSTYIGHENGHRGFPAKKAPLYARRLGVSEEWLLYGKGAPDSDLLPDHETLERMIREVVDSEVTLQTRLGDLPRIVAPALREQLERFRSDRATRPRPDKASAPGKGALSPSPTKPSARGE